MSSGGDSGIGRAVAVHFAREGADVAIVYLDEHPDADETVELVKKEGRKAIKIAGDAAKPEVGWLAATLLQPLSIHNASSIVLMRCGKA